MQADTRVWGHFIPCAVAIVGDREKNNTFEMHCELAGCCSGERILTIRINDCEIIKINLVYYKRDNILLH